MKRKQKCPKCGKVAVDVRHYKDGSSYYIHEQKKAMFGFVEATGCDVPKQKRA